MRKFTGALMVGALLGSTLGAVPAEAKKKDEKSALELQSLQSKDFEAKKDLVFGAVMSVLQDAGYRIQQGSLETGLITGIGAGKSKLTFVPFVGFGRSKKTPAVSAFIEQIGIASHVRLSFVMAKVSQNQYGTSLGDEEPVEDAQVYADAFEKIGQAVFIRQSMQADTKPSADAAPAAASTPSS